MTPLGRFFAIFPGLHLAAIGLAFASFVAGPTLDRAVVLALSVYGVPLAAFKLLERTTPIEEGPSYLDRPEFSPWWAGHQVQTVLNAFPAFETVLRVLPGVYSAWLRHWGGTVGSGVYWTARAEVLDRNLVDVGDRVVVGHAVIFCSHIIKPTKNGLFLWVKRVQVGAGAVLGAECRLGPGARVAEGAVVPVQGMVHARANDAATEAEAHAA